MCTFSYVRICDVSDRHKDLKLADVLFFATGVREVPPAGFATQPQLQFLHLANETFPKANTCTCVLSLPAMHDTYDNFCAAVDFGIRNAYGFGFV